MSSVVRPWLADYCTLKMQAVLLSALRGCDGMPKENMSKPLTRKFRSVLLFPANKRNRKDSYMSADVSQEHLNRFYENLDPYPTHWLFHFAHACEIVGYRHPDSQVATFWIGIYKGICRGLYVNPETPDQMEDRLRDLIPYEESLRS